MSDAAQFAERMHFARARPAVVTHAKDIEREVRRGISADEEGNRLAGANAVVGTITFDPWAAILGRRINLGFGEEPIGGAGAGIFAVDKIGGSRCGEAGATSERGGRAEAGQGLESAAAIQVLGSG